MYCFVLIRTALYWARIRLSDFENGCFERWTGRKIVNLASKAPGSLDDTVTSNTA